QQDKTAKPEPIGKTASRTVDPERRPAGRTVAAAVAEGAPPEVLAGPREGGPDDLKVISGIGPKIEGLLRSQGIFHFDQIAAWTPENVEWMENHLQFKGRILRENWVEQARVQVERKSAKRET